MSERTGVLIAVLSSSFGGTAGAVTRYVVSVIDPVTIAAFRFGIGVIVLLPIALVMGSPLPRGRDWLGKWFAEDVTGPVRLHVDAKRYLTATDGGYFATLSPASVRSLELQGGPFPLALAEGFIALPHAAAAVRLRRWDDSAKVPGKATPDLAHFRPHLDAALRAGA